HPFRPTLAALRARLPRLAEEADRAGRPVPAFAPRIQVAVGSVPDTEDRPLGHGSIEQIRADVETLAELGATHILFDTYPGDPAARGSAEDDRRVLELIASGLQDI
ncbi:LLM class F420-dependent oxidoreductase, partial [Streptomyces sp. SID14478]|nr:LLM class F420-dependent oxidoreductase [Streptomyces sp. SID14478]